MLIDTYPEKSEFISMAHRKNVIPLCMEVLADTETPVQNLARFIEGDDPLFLLESVEGGERWARYSFLGTEARAVIEVYSDRVEVTSQGEIEKIPHDGDPLPVMRKIMAQFRPASQPRLPRFWGGAVGYFNYESISFFEKIPHKWPADKPMARFMVTGNLLIFDNVRHVMTLVKHVFLEKGEDPSKAYDRGMEELKSLYQRVCRVVKYKPVLPAQALQLEPVISGERFREGVSRIKEHILEGDVIQAVYSQPFRCSRPVDPWLYYRLVRYVNPSPYMFFIKIGGPVLVGSSPETMVRLDGGVATLRPIAGTRHRGRTEREDRNLADELLSDPKERAEHLMLVDLGRNDLGRVARVGTVQVTDLMVVEKYSHVMHLVSNINCDLKIGYDCWDLFRATFPAGTLSGAPKIRAMEIIAGLEEEPRGPYGGAAGYVSFDGNMDFAITIRTAQVETDGFTVQAGAGIVADSDPEREREETVNKARALQRSLQLIQKSCPPDDSADGKEGAGL